MTIPIAEWRAPATGRRGGQLIYSALAIETALTIRLVFHQPLRQTEGLLRCIADVLGVDIAIPDHTTLSRRGVGLTVLPSDFHRAEPLHLVVDSTGLKIYGEGEWLDAKRGSRSRRRWRKLHIGINAETLDVMAVELTPDDVGDVSAVPDLLKQIDSRVASLMKCCNVRSRRIEITGQLAPPNLTSGSQHDAPGCRCHSLTTGQCRHATLRTDHASRTRVSRWRNGKRRCYAHCGGRLDAKTGHGTSLVCASCSSLARWLC